MGGAEKSRSQITITVNINGFENVFFWRILHLPSGFVIFSFFYLSVFESLDQMAAYTSSFSPTLRCYLDSSSVRVNVVNDICL